MTRSETLKRYWSDPANRTEHRRRHVEEERRCREFVKQFFAMWKGTRDMVNRARKAGVPVEIFHA